MGAKEILQNILGMSGDWATLPAGVINYILGLSGTDSTQWNPSNWETPNSDTGTTLFDALGYDPNTMANNDWQQFDPTLNPQSYLNDGALAGPNGQYAGTNYGGGNNAAVTYQGPPVSDPYAPTGAPAGSQPPTTTGAQPVTPSPMPEAPGQVAAPDMPQATQYQLPGQIGTGINGPVSFERPGMPNIDLGQFDQLLDAIDFSGISIGGGGSVGSSNVGNIEQRLSDQWSGMWADVNAEVDAQEQREIQTLTEIIQTDWGDQWQHGIAALDARGLSNPGESTTADYWQNKWTGERDQALVQGIRDIQNRASDRRLEWTKFGMEMQSDWAKFDVSSALEARSQDITMRGQDVQAGIASAQISAQLKMFGIESAIDLKKFGIEQATLLRGQDIDFMNAQADRDQSWAETLYAGGVEQRGQDIDFMNSQATRDQNWAETLYQGGVTQRGQDIDWQSDVLTSTDRRDAMAQEWQQFLGNQATMQRGQDLNYSIGQQGLSQGLTIADWQKDSTNSANIWDAAGNIIGSDWFASLWD